MLISSASWARRARSRPFCSGPDDPAMRSAARPRRGFSPSRAMILPNVPRSSIACGAASLTASKSPRRRSTCSPSRSRPRFPRANGAMTSFLTSCAGPGPTAISRVPISRLWLACLPKGSARGGGGAELSSITTPSTAFCAAGAARDLLRSPLAVRFLITPIIACSWSPRTSSSAPCMRISPSRAWRAMSSSSVISRTAFCVSSAALSGWPAPKACRQRFPSGLAKRLAALLNCRNRSHGCGEVSVLLERAGTEGAVQWLMRETGLSELAAKELADYLAAGKAALGALPAQETVIFERFFDESGGMQLVIHSPYGSRINRAWGLALRKRFCRKFNFELQAAATDDHILLSLTCAHSFELIEVKRYLHPAGVRPLLIQALLDAPMFITRWRWVAGISLALPRFRGGKRVPAYLARMEAEDLIGAVFPDQIACF